MLSLTCTWEKSGEHKQDVLEKPFNREKNASLASWPHRGVCFKASVCALKVQLKSTAGVLLELRLISESRMSIHSAVPLSSITSNTNQAFAPLPPSLCPFPLHPPSLPTPSPLIVAVLARGLSVGVADEFNAAGPKCREDRVEDNEWQRHRQRKRKRDMDGSVTGEVDCDALNESQISATYYIFSVRYKSVLSSLSAGEERDFLRKRES